MKVFVVNCYDMEDDSILFIDRVYQNEQEAVYYCCSQNENAINQAKEIHFDYEEMGVL